jgi:indole-3-glycerol phosphate synthase
MGAGVSAVNGPVPHPTAGDFLARIAAHKREELKSRELSRPLAEVRSAATAAPPPRDFRAALSGPAPRLIAEIKRVSPAKGALNPTLSPAALAGAYAAAGAHALSVLTDEAFFHGSDADLVEARGAVRLPVLRKDFVISPYQIYEARALGADAVLLIAALLEPAQLAELHALAAELGLAALVEVHAPDEVGSAIQASATLVGINNRNLATFHVDLATTEAIRPLLPRGVTVVSESGIATAADVRRVLAAGAAAILVGEALVTAPDPAARIGELLGAAAWSK